MEQDQEYRRMTVEEYLSGEETNRPQELAYGVLREPPAPTYQHQMIVGRLHVRLEPHVRRQNAGQVVMAPMDVILDRERALVVQPDLIFVSQSRRDICTDRIWGTPDLVVEVLSTSTRRHDSETKVDWYRRYGVRECWLVDPIAVQVTVIDLPAPDVARAVYEDDQRIRSMVLPRLRLRAKDVFFD